MSFLDELEGLIVNKLGTIKTLISITKLEGRLARLSIFPLIFCILFFLIILTSVWLSTTFLLGYLFWLYCESIICSVIFGLCINIILLLVLKKFILVNLRNMSFIKTREHIDNVITIIEKVKNESTQEASDGNTSPRKKVSDATTSSK